MRISRLLKTIVEWLHRWLKSSSPTKSPQPFISVREKRYPLGLLKLVEGRDTSHAIRTWIISPVPFKDAVLPLDIHIYLDFIGVTADENRRYLSYIDVTPSQSPNSKSPKTHTITVLEASRTLQEDGNYRYEHIFSGHYDFKGQLATSADVQARIACDRIAVLGGMRPVSDLNWADEIEEIYSQVMGREGLPHTEAFKFWRKKPASHSSRFPSFKSRTKLSSNASNTSNTSTESPQPSATTRYSLNNSRIARKRRRIT